MRHYLVTPSNRSSGNALNVGHHTITDGIRWLMTLADPEAVFAEIDLMGSDPTGWDMAELFADTILICGNPRIARFMDRHDDWGMWQWLLRLHERGIPVADIGAGADVAGVTKDFTAEVDLLQAYDRAQQVLAYEAKLPLVIARDATFHQLATAAGAQPLLLPCPSWWAPKWHDIGLGRRHNAISVRLPAEAPWLPAALVQVQRHLETMRPTWMVVVTTTDYHIMADAGATRLTHLTSGEAALRFYAATEILVSLRLHATIPALAMGVRVANYGTESRSLALDVLGFPWYPYPRLQMVDPVQVLADAVLVPDYAAVDAREQDYVSAFRATILR